MIRSGPLRRLHALPIIRKMRIVRAMSEMTVSQSAHNSLLWAFSPRYIPSGEVEGRAHFRTEGRPAGLNLCCEDKYEGRVLLHSGVEDGTHKPDELIPHVLGCDTGSCTLKIPHGSQGY